MLPSGVGANREGPRKPARPAFIVPQQTPSSRNENRRSPKVRQKKSIGPSSIHKHLPAFRPPTKPTNSAQNIIAICRGIAVVEITTPNPRSNRKRSAPTRLASSRPERSEVERPPHFALPANHAEPAVIETVHRTRPTAAPEPEAALNTRAATPRHATPRLAQSRIRTHRPPPILRPRNLDPPQHRAASARAPSPNSRPSPASAPTRPTASARLFWKSAPHEGRVPCLLKATPPPTSSRR